MAMNRLRYGQAQRDRDIMATSGTVLITKVLFVKVLFVKVLRVRNSRMDERHNYHQDTLKVPQSELSKTF